MFSSAMNSPMPTKIKDNRSLILSTAILALLVFVRDIGVYHFSPTFLLIVVTVICIILPYRNLTTFFFYYIPFCFSIHGMVMLPIMVALLFKSRRINFNQIIFTILILLFELVHLLSYEFEVDYIKYLVYAAFIFLYFFMLYDDNYDDYSVLHSIKYYVIGCSVILVTIVVHSIMVYGVDGVLLGAMRIGGDDTAFDLEGPIDVTRMNANNVAYFSITAISLILFSPKCVYSSFERFFFLFLLFFVGVLSTSRTWLILMGVIFILFFLFSGVKRKISGLILVITLFFVVLQYTEYTENFVDRFSSRMEDQENVESLGGRVDLFKAYNDYMNSHPERKMYGTGVLYYSNICKIWNGMHSGVQQIYVCYGIIGIMIFLTSFFLFYRKYLRGKKVFFFNIIPFIICLIFDQTIQFLSPHALMFPFVATLLPFKLSRMDDLFD